MPNSMSGWLLYIGFGALVGAFGQLLRSAIGLKKMRDNDVANDRTVGASFSLGEFVTSLITGAVAGVLAVLLIKPEISKVSIEIVTGIMAAGYSGADFIDGAFGKVFQKSGGSDAQKTLGEIPTQPGGASDPSQAPLDWMMSRPGAMDQNWRDTQ